VEIHFPNARKYYVFRGISKPVTNYMDHSPPCEAKRLSARQEIPRLLWNPIVIYHVHKSPPLVSILSQMNPVHNFRPCFPKIRSNVVLSSTLISSEWSLRFRFATKMLYAFLVSPAANRYDEMTVKGRGTCERRYVFSIFIRLWHHYVVYAHAYIKMWQQNLKIHRR
jgi:hypothetical protein